MGYFDLLQETSQQYGDNGDRSIAVAQQQFIKHFYDSPSYHSILKNDVNAECWILDENTLNKNPNKKRILMKPTQTIAVGDIVYVNDWSENWLCTNRDSDDSIYDRGIVEKCNNTLKVKVDELESIDGYDDLDRPITSTTPIYYTTPCIATTTLRTTGITDSDEQINLPEGYLNIIYRYDSDNVVDDGVKFEMYGAKYEIVEKDMTKVINDSGVVTMLVKKIV